MSHTTFIKCIKVEAQYLSQTDFQTAQRRAVILNVMRELTNEPRDTAAATAKVPVGLTAGQNAVQQLHRWLFFTDQPWEKLKHSH